MLRRWRSATSSDLAVENAGVEYALVRCESCGTAVTEQIGLAPRDTISTAGMYEGGYYSRPPRLLDRVIEPLRRISDRGRARTLGELSEGDSVLEFGAGDGRLLELLRGHGALVAGIEPSPAARERAAERGVQLFPDLETSGIESGSIDLIVFWHVLEHLPDPASDLLRARDLLRPGGKVVISVPNLASLQAKIGADSWFGQDVPRHLTHFTPAGVEAISRRVELELESVDFWSLEQNPFGMWQTLVNRASGSRDVIFRCIKRQSIGTSTLSRIASLFGLLLALPLLVIAIPLEAAASLLRSGGSVTATLRRPFHSGADQ